MKDSFEKLMHNEDFIFLLVEDDNEAVGYAWFEIRDYPENAFKKGYRSAYVHQISINETNEIKVLEQE